MTAARSPGRHRSDHRRARHARGQERRARSRRDPRPLHRRRPGGTGLHQGVVRRRRPVGPRRPDRQHLRSLGGTPSPSWLRSGRARTSTRSRTPAGSMARSECSADWRRSAHCEHAGFQPVRPIELLMFTSEEPTRFGIGCLGSRALSGALAAESMAALRDTEGRAFDEVRRAAGFPGRAGERPAPRRVLRRLR